MVHKTLHIKRTKNRKKKNNPIKPWGMMLRKGKQFLIH
jgi:hypothetical protein